MMHVRHFLARNNNLDFLMPNKSHILFAELCWIAFMHKTEDGVSCYFDF